MGAREALGKQKGCEATSAADAPSTGAGAGAADAGAVGHKAGAAEKGPASTGGSWGAVCAGLGLLLAWMMSLLMRGGVLSGPYDGQRSLSFDPFFVAAVATASLCLAALCLPLRFLLRRLKGRALIAWVGVCVAAAAVATAVSGMAPFASAPAPVLLGVVCGACLAVMLMLWLLVLTGFDPRDTVVMVLADILIALGGFLVIHFTGKVMGSPQATSAASVAFLVVSFALLARSWRFLDVAPGPVQEPPMTLVRLSLFAFAAAAVVEYASAFMVGAGREAFFQGTHDRFVLQIAGLVACAAACAALAAALRVLDKRTGVVVVALYRIIVLVLVCGLAMALLPYGFLLVPTDTVILLGRFLALFGTWAIALHAVFLQGRDAVGSIALLLVAQLLGLLAGFLLGLRALAVPDGTAWPAIVLAASLVLVAVVALFVFTDLDASAVERVGLRETSHDGGDALEDRVAAARERFGLTEREGEVLALLSRGRNAASIQEALCVSYNTVKVHKRNIYMKMDIHSQQELLDIMEDMAVPVGVS